MPQALALSPHLDDAVFSCGGTLARLVNEGWQVTICTAFTRSVPSPSGFALACQLDKGLPPDADYMGLRKAEDAAACERLGASPLWLDLPEAPHRGYANAQALFAPPRNDDAVALPLSDMLRDLLKVRPALLLAPQALGGHVDHVLLIRALRVVLPSDLPVWWWADFPYAIRPHTHPVSPFEQEMNILPEVAVRGDAEARFTACAAYVTQVGFQFGGAAALAGMLEAAGPVERLRAQGAHNIFSSSARRSTHEPLWPAD
ncbi:PIG-L deacetylase family protein [Rhodopila sp.]|uniref:PIG-L deacetylase family protein n=1 Tax=Rhodopila sp. TaxID=2480087 RepID=UPI003D0E080B